MSAPAPAPAGPPSSFPPQLATVQVEDKGHFAVVTLNRAPVNGMSLELWSDLLAALDACERTPQIRGIIFASGLEKDIFTAGNDIRELYSRATTPERFKQFWTAQTTCLTRLYTSRLATVAAIRGACPAGGCIFALCCDYRVMTSDVPGASIGLNESALGVSVPRYWIQLYIRTLGSPRAEHSLGTGIMLTPEQALSGGMVHQLAPKAQLMAEAEKALQLYLRHPDAGRVITKLDGRRELAEKWQAYCAEEAAGAWAMLSSPATTQVLGQVLARLSGAAKGGAQAKKPQSKL